MKKNIISILIVISALAFATVTVIRTDVFAPIGTAFAVGDLTINWGVLEGDPIFTVTDFAPGQSESASVVVTNNAASARPLAVRGLHTAGNGISDVLDLIITADGVPVYGTGSGTGAKTLNQFFTDSGGINGIALLTLAAGDNTTLQFTVTFAVGAGNNLQNDSVTFDIKLGTAFDIPAACSTIAFAGEPIFGTDQRDRIRGTAGNDLIIAFEGNDTVVGEGGDDCIIGGAGNDKLRGESGHDVLLGEAGNDNLRGDSGRDYLDGGVGNDNLRGDGDADTLVGGDGNDNLRGDSGDDQLLGGAGNDDMRGDPGDDRMEGGSGNDTMRGDTGNDILLGGIDQDNARGDTGTDQCEAEVKRDCEL